MKTIFDHLSYRLYLLDRLPTQGSARGLRAKLAVTLRVRAAFISQVLQGKNDFSPEHAVLINEFLHHSDEESEYFLLLVQYERAGSEKLRKALRKQIERHRKVRRSVQSRVRIQSEFDIEAQTRYYQSWQIAAVHVLTMIQSFQSIEAIANRLRLPEARVAGYLKILQGLGLVEITKELRYCATNRRMHLPSDSPVVNAYHLGWRSAAMNRLGDGDKESLHFSGVISLSKVHADVVREILLESIEKMEGMLTESPDEEAMVLAIDYFRL